MAELKISTKSFISKIKNLSTTVLWDKSFGNAIIINEKLNNYTPDLKLAGPVFIVNVNNDILPVIQALHSIPENHILVVNNINKDTSDALLGDILFTAAKLQKLSGIVVFGKIRDIDTAAEIKIPLWARGTSINPAKLGCISEKFPNEIEIDQKTIRQGDWLIGDGDGLISIRKENLRIIIKSAEFKNKLERSYITRLKEGNRISDLMNLENFLQGKGEIIIDF